MSFAIIDLVAEMFISVFGNPFIVALVLATFIIFFLLSIRADLTVILIVLIPFFIGIGINSMTTDIINIPVWIIIISFLIAGLLFSALIIYLAK